MLDVATRGSQETFETIDIKATAELMLKEMDHPFARGEKVYDVTFENVQAGLRTDYLFRLAILDGWRGFVAAHVAASYAVYQRFRHYELARNPASREAAARLLADHKLDR